MAVALMAKRRPMGVIELRDKIGSKPFTKADVRILVSIANHFSIIMERADLFGELKRSIKELSTLHEVGSLVTSTLDQAVVRHRAVEAITKLMRAETGSLLVVDQESDELYFEVALGDKGRRLKEVRLNVGEGIAGWVAKHGRVATVHDVTKDPRFQPGVDRHSKFKTRNMICVPVKMKGRVIGVLQAINRVGASSFTKEDQRLFTLLANQVAVALESARLYAEIRDTFYATSSALAEAIETRDPYTGGHTRRVLEYCLAIAKELKLSGPETEVLRLSAVLHDIGKIGIEDSILKKNAPLNHDEQTIMKLHPEMGVEILKHVPHLKDIIPGMLHHHERIDGLGYPHRMAGEAIPLSAKIISVADTYDAMTTTRPYRTGLHPESALGEIKKHSGRQFDPLVVDAFLRAFENGAIKETRQA
jgi:GAF domain-containing protein